MSQPTLVEDFMGLIKLYSDGTVLREQQEPTFGLAPLDAEGRVAFRDLVFDSTRGLWVRLYLPSQCNTHMPVIVYFHGGGFCLFSPASLLSHRFCLKWAPALGAIIVSVNYRLAPEHRLPAAYEDSIAALEWLHSQSTKKKAGEDIDPWFDSHADFSNVYLMGESAGGNIAHHVGMWAAGKDWEQLRIRGMILLQPYLGAEERTASEIGCDPASAALSLEASDQMWRLALPVGGNKDGHFSNPVGPGSNPSVADAALPPVVVVIGGRDLLRDRQLEYCQALEKCGQRVKVVVFEEEDHGFFTFKLEEESSLKALEYLSEFIKSMV